MLGRVFKHKPLMLNDYAKQFAGLYKGMDLKKTSNP